MSRLTERYVQNASLVFLKKYYEKKYNLDDIICKKEVVTYYKKRKGRADGLLAFRKEGAIYTVSLEAKSFKTLNSLLSYCNNFVFRVIAFTIFGILFALSLFLLWKYSWIVKVGFSLFLGLLFSFVFLIFIEDKALLKKHGIIEQVRRYPANEQWISFSKDAYDFFDSINDHELKIRAKRYGIGIIIVNKANKINIELEAKENKLRRNVDYLKYYSQGSKIEKELV